MRFMSNDRIKYLKEIQENRYKVISELIGNEGFSFNQTPEAIFKITNDKNIIDYYFGFKNYSQRKNNKNNLSFSDLLNRYKKRNIERLNRMAAQDTFISDYYKVLQNLILAIKDPEKLYFELGIENLSDKDWQDSTEDKTDNRAPYPKSLSGFKKLINRSLSSTIAKGKVLFIDEAQDCHPLEKEIFLSLWEKRNIVVCTGGKEQLIRHEEECNWKLDSNNRILHNVIEITKRNRTYRIKENIVKLCNYIANEFQINIDLSAIRTDMEDLGNVIIEMSDPNYSSLKNIVKKLSAEGEKNEICNYESILFLTESSSKNIFEDNFYKQEEFQINSYDNISSTENTTNKQSIISKLTNISEDNFYFYHMNESQKNLHDQDEEPNNYYMKESPNADTFRCIFYESCRGLEAWSVVCLDIDLFYERKREEEAAAKFLSDDLFLSDEERRNKYAATWLLMALTRPINTLYIHIHDKNSYLGKILQKYIEQS